MTLPIQSSYMCTDKGAIHHDACDGDCDAVGNVASEIASASNHGKNTGLLNDKARKRENSARNDGDKHELNQVPESRKQRDRGH